MSSLERSKKKVHLWKKAMVHFSLCFVMGFFTGFAPTGRSSMFSSHVSDSGRAETAPKLQVPHQPTNSNTSSVSSPAPVPVAAPKLQVPHQPTNSNTSSVSSPAPVPVAAPAWVLVNSEPELKPRRFVIIVTPTSAKLPFQAVHLRRLANTIKLIPQPLLWIVVEAQRESSELSEILRKTGIMFRHLVFKENFTDLEAELNHQRNLALKHIEHHRLSGIVHFAGLNNVYDLEFFNQLRDIEVFGTWPMAMLAANRKKVRIEGPVCDSSEVIGWHLRNINNETDRTPPIHISSFAFNSSILWDPERWGRTSSVQDTSQNSIKFVKQVVVEDEAKLKGIPAEDCSRIMLWRLNFHGGNAPPHHFLRISSDGNGRRLIMGTLRK